MTAVAPESRLRRRLSPLALVEALATPHGLDRYLELVHPLLTVRELRAEVTDVRRATPDSVTLTLRPTRQWEGFAAGQFVQLTVDIDGVRRTRCYSPASSQHRSDGRIELTVKAHADGLVSRHLYDHARPGLVVGLSQADGAFRLPEARPARILLISGGSGITPVLSILRTLCEEDFAGEVAFLHYARRAADVPYRDELAAIAAEHPNVRIAVGYTRQRADAGLRGRFGAAHLQAVAPWYADAETYVCGPQSLMASVREVFTAAGLGDRLHSEDFTPPALLVDAGDARGTVAFERSGIAAANTGTTLLEQAEAAGLSPEHGCRMGICFSCTQVKTSGCTRNILTGDLHTESDEEIQLCISVPVGDVALDL
jgi:ferredoxin-NADP reductase